MKGGVGAGFEKVACEPSESILQFLANLLKQEIYFLQITKKDNLLFLDQKKKSRSFFLLKVSHLCCPVIPKI